MEAIIVMGIWLVLALTISDALTVLAFIGAAVATLAVGKSKSKDNTIHTLENETRALVSLLETRERELTGAATRADNAQQLCHEAEIRESKLLGTIEELRPYGEAFKELIVRVERTEAVIASAIHEQGELILQSTHVSSQSSKALEQIVKTLETLSTDFGAVAERLGAGQERPAIIPKEGET